MGIDNGSNNIRLGKNWGSFDLNALKSGIKRTDLNADQQTIFDKIDTDKNGVLTRDEIESLQRILSDYTDDGKISKRDAKKIIKNNDQLAGIEKKELLTFLKEIGGGGAIDTSKLSQVKEYDDPKTKTPLLELIYNANENGETIKETLRKSDGTKYSTEVKTNGKTVTTYFDETGKKVTKEVTVENGTTTILDHLPSGAIGKTVIRGTEEKVYINDKLQKSILDKGHGVIESSEFIYDETGNPLKIIKTSTADDNKTIIEKGEDNSTIYTTYDKNGEVLSTKTKHQDGTTIINDGKEIKTTAKDGSYTIENIETGKITKFDKYGKEIIENQSYNVQYGDTWYGIVQAKYGITDHNQTMAIVRELKSQNNVDPKATNMPKTIQLPEKIKLADGTEIELNMDGKVDNKHNNVTNKDHSLNKTPLTSADTEIKDPELTSKKEENAKLRAEGREIAESLHNDMKGIGTKSTFSTNFGKINKDNVADVILAYREFSNEESISEAIIDEVGMSYNERKDYIQKLYENLEAKCKDLGLETEHFKTQFNNCIANSPKWNNDEFDVIFEGMASSITAARSLTNQQKAEINRMTPQEQKKMTVDVLNNTVSGANQNLQAQLNKDGWAGKAVDKISVLWGSENREKLVKEDISKFESQINELANSSTQTDFETKFKEIYGIEYNPTMVKAYEQRQEQLINATALYGLEQAYNDSCKTLLKSPTLTEEIETIYGDDGYDAEFVTAKEQVYNRELNNFASMVEDIGLAEKGKGIEYLKAKLQESGADLTDNSFDDEYSKLHNMAKELQTYLNNSVNNATEGKGYEAFKNECDKTYNAAFGTTNDIAKRVADYNISQQAGAKALKTTVVVTASVIAGIATGGTSLLATASIAGGTTAVTRATVEFTDLGSNNIDGDVKANASNIIKQSLTEGAISFVTAGATKGLGNIMSKSTQTASSSVSVVDDIAGNTVGATDDVANSGLVIANSSDDFANAAGNMADDATSAAGKSTNAAGNMADDATSAAGKSTNAAGNMADDATSATGKGTNARSDTQIFSKWRDTDLSTNYNMNSANSEFLENLSTRFLDSGKGVLNSMSDDEMNQLAKILGKTPEQVKNMTRKDWLNIGREADMIANNALENGVDPAIIKQFSNIKMIANVAVRN